MKPRFALGILLALAGTARAEDSDGSRSGVLDVLRSAELTVGVGAVLPMFVVYEFPGPLVVVTAGWTLNERMQVVANADLGMLHADGARRYVGSLGVGLRVSPWRRGPWVQLGLGATGFIERIGIVLPDRMVTGTDVGGLFTGDIAIGARIARWEVGVGYDHILAPRPYYHIYMGVEELPHVGTAMAWFGRQL